MKENFTNKVNEALKEQGRTKLWLASKLGVRPSSLGIKMKAGTYSVADMFYISHLLNIKE